MTYVRGGCHHHHQNGPRFDHASRETNHALSFRRKRVLLESNSTTISSLLPPELAIASRSSATSLATSVSKFSVSQSLTLLPVVSYLHYWTSSQNGHFWRYPERQCLGHEATTTKSCRGPDNRHDGESSDDLGSTATGFCLATTTLAGRAKRPPQHCHKHHGTAIRSGNGNCGGDGGHYQTTDFFHHRIYAFQVEKSQDGDANTPGRQAGW